jgi:hypothetical protein
VLAAFIVAVAVLFCVVARVRPAYDAYGWLAWGHQAWHLALNTDAAPSWKPLTFLFTLPLALAGHDGAVSLWMVTAAAGAFALPLLAADLARRLIGGGVAGGCAGVLAAVAILDIAGFWHGVLTATADAPIAALLLGGINAHLAGRRHIAFALLCLAALGRPEAAPYAVVYGLWLWWRTRAARAPVLGGLAAVVVLWVGIPAITSHTPFSAGTTALTASAPVHGSPIFAVIRNFLALDPLAVHLAALGAVGVAAYRRDRRMLVLAASAVLWVVIWCVLAAGGWEPDGRYMLAPAAVEAVLAAAAIGRLAGVRPSRPVIRSLAVAGATALTLALVPVTVSSGRLLYNGVLLGQNWADQLGRLQAVIDSHGGARRILACGTPVTTVSYQSVLAYDLGANVSQVGWQPGSAIAARGPIVLFLPYVAGWHVRPIHSSPAARVRCRGLRLTTPYAYSAAFRDFLEDDGLLGPHGRACSLPGTPPCRRPRSGVA